MEEVQNGFQSLLGLSNLNVDEGSIANISVENIIITDSIDLTDVAISGLDTDDVLEGSNLYYTEGRVNNNINVSANTTHRGIVSGNPHSVLPSDLGISSTGSGAIISLAERTQIGTNQIDIATNTSNISTNAGNISTNAGNISTNAGNISTNAGNISTNTSNISTNAGNISLNTTHRGIVSGNPHSVLPLDLGITSTGSGSIITSAERTQIGTNQTNISTNASNISTNTNDIATNTIGVSTNAGNITTLQTDIKDYLPLSGGVMSGAIAFDGMQYIGGVLETHLAKNATDVSVVDNSLIRMEGTTGKYIHTSSAVLDDSGNLSGINNITLSGLVDGVDIATLNTSVGTNTSNIATNTTDISNRLPLSGGTITGNLALNADIHMTNNDITNVDNIYTNKFIVADGTSSSPSISFMADSDTGMYSDTADTLQFSTGGTEKLFINNTLNMYGAHGSGSYVSMGTTPLSANNFGTIIFPGTSTYLSRFDMYIQGSLTTTSRTYVMKFNGTTGVKLNYNTGSWASTSDIRFKDNVKKIRSCCDKLSTIDGIKYKFKKDPHKKDRIGVSAQAVQAVFPELVDTTFEPEPYAKEDEKEQEVLSVRYSEFVPILINAINELSATNKLLSERLEKIEKKLI